MSDVEEFIKAACVPLDASHSSGTLDRANSILARYPEVASASIYAAAVLGDGGAVTGYITSDSAAATRKGGPYDWDALSYLCFSRYLRLDKARSDRFVTAARALLDAGADPNTGWWENNHQPNAAFEPVLYGAAGVAHHAGLTRLLIDRGADPNADEIVYHTPEGYDNGALEALVESGKLTPDSLATMLLRKHDWHDYDGVVFLLSHGAQPNHLTRWQRTAFQHAILRDNDLDIIRQLLDHGANPDYPAIPLSPGALAARRGRGDVLEELNKRGISIQLDGVDRLIAACATDDADSIEKIAREKPELVARLVSEGGKLLAEFSGVGNTPGVRRLLDLGVSVTERFKEGDGYYGIAKNSNALHVAAWRAQHSTVKLLIARGAEVEATNAAGETPLQLAVKACVDSYWMERRSPESVKALLAAGASGRAIPLPTGYAEIDALIEVHPK